MKNELHKMPKSKLNFEKGFQIVARKFVSHTDRVFQMGALSKSNSDREIVSQLQSCSKVSLRNPF